MGLVNVHLSESVFKTTFYLLCLIWWFVQAFYSRLWWTNATITSCQLIFTFLYRMGLSLVKTTSVASPFQRVPLKTTQQQLRKPAEPVGTSVFRRGYDGLGGHTKFVAPSRPKKAVSRKVARPTGVSKFIKSNKHTNVEPPLPVMELNLAWNNI